MNKGVIDTVKILLQNGLKIETDEAGKPVIRGIKKCAVKIADLLEFRNKQIDRLRDERDTLRAELDVITGADTNDPRKLLSALIRRRQALDDAIVATENRT